MMAFKKNKSYNVAINGSFSVVILWIICVANHKSATEKLSSEAKRNVFDCLVKLFDALDYNKTRF